MLRESFGHLAALAFVLLVCVATALGSTVVPAAAQAPANASIIGRVTDESGSVLPGVTVSATSPALQVPESLAVTDGGGEYRLVQLPVGEYVVTYTLAGFQTVRLPGIRLTIGFVARLDQALKIATLEESVTVTGQSPLVDVTSANVRTEFLRETIEVLPTSRNSLHSLLQVTPGVKGLLDVGGNQTGNRGSISTFSRSGQNEPMIEGVLTRHGDGSNPGAYYDYNTFEEARVETMTHSAEVALAGINFNAVIKSGGNQYHGTYAGSRVLPRLQSDNIDEELQAKGITNNEGLKVRYDVSGDFGGRIIRDNLWFYSAVRRQKTVQDRVGFLKPDGTPGLEPNWLTFWTWKLSHQLSAGNKLTAYQQWNNKHVIGYISRYHAYESRADQQQPAANAKIEWTGVFGSTAVASAQYGHWFYDSRVNGFSEDVARYDVVTLRYTGETITSPGPGTPARLGNWRRHVRSSISLYEGDVLLGDHEIKAGLDYFQEMKNWALLARPSRDYSLQFSNGAPFRLITYNRPVDPQQRVNYTGTYVSDAWRLGQRLTLNLGLRFDRYNMFLPDQPHPGGTFAEAQVFPKIQFAIWNALAPRLHFSYNLRGDGRTAIKGGWGRFNDMRDAFEPDQWNPNGLVTTTYLWRDENGNRDYDVGEVDLGLGGRDYRSRTGGTTRVPNPDERQPKTDEFVLSLEQQFAGVWATRVSGRLARNTNVRALVNTLRPFGSYTVPVTDRDPGPDGRPGTADDPGTFVTYYEYPAALHGVGFERSMNVNVPDWVNSWKTIELAVTRRPANGWQVMASYSATRQETGPPPANPNDEIFSRNKTWDWQVKAAGSYQLPRGFLVSANLQHLAGTPYARDVLFRGGAEITTIVLRVEPIGARRRPNINLVDLRLQKRVELNGTTLTLHTVVYNLLNTNTVTNLTTRSGASFENPTAIVPPRIAELGFSYAF